MDITIKNTNANNRRGSLLIVVVGVASLLAVTATAALLRVQSDARANRIVMQEAQCRLALTAALHFLLETSRLGHHDSEEAYGWVDIRDGLPGPRTASVTSIGGGNWPALGSTLRADLYAKERPPYAIEQNPAPAAVNFEVDRSAMKTFLEREGSGVDWDTTSNTELNSIWSSAVSGPRNEMLETPRPAVDAWSDFIAGDNTPRAASLGRGWFRIYREPQDWSLNGPVFTDSSRGAGDFLPGSTFIVTVGAGASRGFRNWAEANTSGLFPSQAVFDRIRAAERIMRFRVRWVPNVGGNLESAWRHLPWPFAGWANRNAFGVGNQGDWFSSTEPRAVQANNRWLSFLLTNYDPGYGFNSQRNGDLNIVDDPPIRNDDINPVIQQGGSIEWIRRLDKEPNEW